MCLKDMLVINKPYSWKTRQPLYKTQYKCISQKAFKTKSQNTNKQKC